MMGFGFDSDSLRGASSKMIDAVAGVDGKVVAGLPAGPAEYGHDELFAAFEEFCSAVDIGVDVLVTNAASAGSALADAVRTYQDSDDAVSSALIGIVNDLDARLAKGE